MELTFSFLGYITIFIKMHAADGVWPAEVCHCAMCDVQAVVGGRERYGAGEARKPVEGHVLSCSQAAHCVCGVKGLN